MKCDNGGFDLPLSDFLSENLSISMPFVSRNIVCDVQKIRNLKLAAIHIKCHVKKEVIKILNARYKITRH